MMNDEGRFATEDLSDEKKFTSENKDGGMLGDTDSASIRQRQRDKSYWKCVALIGESQSCTKIQMVLNDETFRPFRICPFSHHPRLVT